MRAADLDDIFELVRLRIDRQMDFQDRRDQFVHSLNGRDVHCRWESVVRRLRHVHVIVRMNRLFAAHDAAGNFDRAIRDHFVGVHVRLRSATRLPNAQRKMFVELAFNHFVARLDDQLQFVFRKFSEIVIYQRAGFLENAKSANHLARHHIKADVEVEQATLCLRAPILVGGDFDLAHRIGFDARIWF